MIQSSVALMYTDFEQQLETAGVQAGGNRAVLNQDLALDKNQNSVVSLQEMGVDTAIRCARLEGSMWFSEMDMAMAVTGKSNMQSGVFNMFLSLPEVLLFMSNIVSLV
ncbi:MAG: hypothetical protein ORN83_05275 [Chthoniobacteraceae bacterium]|nr:hypothetical protein [Chthoniobacteraceae bacterium]